MKAHNLPEALGELIGYPVGLLTGAISFLRNARMFHPKGILTKAEVESLLPDMPFTEKVLVRFSSALWKDREWKDVLGISLRFYRDKVPVQDLLFASFPYPWETPIGPFLTDHKDFFANTFYAVSPFEYQGEKMKFKITFSDTCQGENRHEKLMYGIHHHHYLILWKGDDKNWTQVARIRLLKEIALDQEDLRMAPFLNGLGIKPVGFIHYLRIGAYRFSQKGRALRRGRKEVVHKIDDRFILHGL